MSNRCGLCECCFICVLLYRLYFYCLHCYCFDRIKSAFRVAGKCEWESNKRCKNLLADYKAHQIHAEARANSENRIAFTRKQIHLQIGINTVFVALLVATLSNAHKLIISGTCVWRVALSGMCT